MNKKLPSIFSNKIDKKLNNNEEFFVSKNNQNKKTFSKEEIIDKINKIIKSNDFIYRAEVIITLKDDEINKKIIGIKDPYLLTLDGDIKIEDIYDIKLKD